MNNFFPLISVVLNVYNESKNISRCLGRIRNQVYPRDRIEIIVVDDDSTDNTVSLAKQFDVKIVRSGYKNRERAKSIGLEQARGEFILFIDADVFLISKHFLRKCIELFLKYPTIVAVQSIRWYYRRNEPIANRYCNLFGVNDPMPLFLNKRGVLMATEDEWPYKDTIVERGNNYFLVKFNTSDLPTVGAQGYIVRKKDIKKTSWSPYFFHLDTALELVIMGRNEFAMTKLAVEHRYVQSIKQFYMKLARNIDLYLTLHEYRKYNYGVGSLKFFVALFLMLSIVYPSWQSIRGFMKKPDIAWFLHPLFCFTIPVMYAFILVKWRAQSLWKKDLARLL